MQHPFRLRFDPNNELSRTLYQFVPAFSFANLAEIYAFRKNAIIAYAVGSAAAG